MHLVRLGERAHRFVQPFFTILLLIGCLSISTGSIAADFPAYGGYYAQLSLSGGGSGFGTGPYSSIQEAITVAAIGTPPSLCSPRSATVIGCYGAIWIDESIGEPSGNYSGPWLAGTYTTVGSTAWGWSRHVRVLIETQYYYEGSTTPGGSQIDFLLGDLTLYYQCNVGSTDLRRMKDDPVPWGPDQLRPPQSPICTDGLPECPVTALTPIPAGDVCAQTLEAYNSTPAQKTAACGTLTPAMQTAVGCFGGKLGTINNPATGQPIPLVITADIRNLAYQAHLREIWDNMEDIVFETTRNPALQTACAARRAEIAAEKGCDNAGACAACNAPTATARNHCLVSRPAPPNPNDATHVQGNAIDVSRSQTVDPLQSALSQRTPPQSIQGLLDAPTNCRLDYLGVQDPVHFQLRP